MSFPTSVPVQNLKHPSNVTAIWIPDLRSAC